MSDREIMERVADKMFAHLDAAVGFRPACPRCDRLCDPGAIWCAECGSRLYPAWSGRYERT